MDAEMESLGILSGDCRFDCCGFFDSRREILPGARNHWWWDSGADRCCWLEERLVLVRSDNWYLVWPFDWDPIADLLQSRNCPCGTNTCFLVVGYGGCVGCIADIAKPIRAVFSKWHITNHSIRRQKAARISSVVMRLGEC